jgi:toxin YoeB
VKLIFDKRAWDDYLHWQAHDTKMLKRINALLKECMRTPLLAWGNQSRSERTFLVTVPPDI